LATTGDKKREDKIIISTGKRWDLVGESKATKKVKTLENNSCQPGEDQSKKRGL